MLLAHHSLLLLLLRRRRRLGLLLHARLRSALEHVVKVLIHGILLVGRHAKSSRSSHRTHLLLRLLLRLLRQRRLLRLDRLLPKGTRMLLLLSHLLLVSHKLLLLLLLLLLPLLVHRHVGELRLIWGASSRSSRCPYSRIAGHPADGADGRIGCDDTRDIGSRRIVGRDGWSRDELWGTAGMSLSQHVAQRLTRLVTRPVRRETGAADSLVVGEEGGRRRHNVVALLLLLLLLDRRRLDRH